jgi:hypothetical protein
MKPERTKAHTQDRLATSEEVRRAISGTPDLVLEYCYGKGTHCEIHSDLGGIIRYAAEEFELFAYLSETEDSVVN